MKKKSAIIADQSLLFDLIKLYQAMNFGFQSFRDSRSLRSVAKLAMPTVLSVFSDAAKRDNLDALLLFGETI